MGGDKDVIPSVFNTMSQLSPAIYLRDFTHAPEKNDRPLTIILFFWMNATYRPAAKYISEYIRIAPNARIISVFTSASDFFIRNSDASQKRRVASVLDTILSTGGLGRDKGDTSGRLYVHAFSNGGSITLRNLAASYRDVTGRALPLSALLIDSAPGKTTLAGAIKALSYSFPKFFLWRILLSAAIWVLLFSLTTIGRILGRKHPAYRIREGLNDASLIHRKAERCYVYSKEDELIMWKDVEQHADQAHSRGWKVSREMFEKSPHVGHMRTDPQRYWMIVARLLKVSMA
ncbi:hypothetical protein LOZ53_001038 [Ophidiomyces ophidiicola]|uniref:Uncharacterized protein n=1 Tax=Ophidiomyces ophidiicola TaxID=1387563 RepID=A0ACB8UVX5_9EURO|nr:uncharacterized protein LOZ57_000963 [Ophidiomyces ophidiicola]KAI1912946.1 hypothetical protein LOZ64_004271 [Ophidiomyces ophidiicola]KAI1915302.1 hypothetical protein LOZ61_001700 [Ophidiomyces ophidiicola]KAI1926784.1 hypothetical protein LOZ60_003381 [Ophidiomyces ophidiicola]KAI1945944.1 hypothetical protein LOZ62_003547 [Ophidiomyces ophidiicola]KAI1952880.1 hypothetical protein LOZ57_000963 [Ophidiomyces ophidiicola]